MRSNTLAVASGVLLSLGTVAIRDAVFPDTTGVGVGIVLVLGSAVLAAIAEGDR